MSQISVLVLSVPIEPPLYVTSDKRTVTIGRGEECDVRLPDPTVSLKHATIRKRGRNFVLLDEGSFNGTAVLGAPGSDPVWLTEDSPRIVQSGDRLQVGQVELQLQIDDSPAGLPSDDLARDLVTVSLSSLELELSEKLIEDSLRELTELPDEGMPNRPSPEPSAPLEDGGVVSEEAPRLTTDLFLVALAVAFALLGLGGLYWLLFLR